MLSGRTWLRSLLFACLSACLLDRPPRWKFASVMGTARDSERENFAMLAVNAYEACGQM